METWVYIYIYIENVFKKNGDLGFDYCNIYTYRERERERELKKKKKKL
jgi:hypothetical protein